MLSDGQIMTIDFMLFGTCVGLFVLLVYFALRFLIPLRLASKTKDGRPLNFWEIDRSNPTKLLGDFLFPPPEFSQHHRRFSWSLNAMTIATVIMFIWAAIIRPALKAGGGG